MSQKIKRKKKNQIPWFYQISPDSFTRYFIIKEILKKTFKKRHIKILDIGGKGNHFWEMLKNDKLPYDLTIVDVLPSDKFFTEYTYIKADITELTLQDEAFDVVVSTDVLEHISNEKKIDFIKQSVRLAKDLVIIAAPFFNQDTDMVEHLANDFYKQYNGKNHPWLEEHFEREKPDKKLIEAFLKEKKLPFLFFESNNLENWLLTMLINFLSHKLEFDKKKFKQLNYFFNDNFLSLNDFYPPGYRQYYVIFKKNNPIKEFKYFFKEEINPKNKLFFYKLVMNFMGNEILQREKINNKLKDQLNNLENEISFIKNSKYFKFWGVYTKLKSFLRLYINN